MEKQNNLGLLIGGALLGGAAYFLFFTERGRQLRDQLADATIEKVDEWLAELEQYLEEKEREAESQEAAEPS